MKFLSVYKFEIINTDFCKIDFLLEHKHYFYLNRIGLQVYAFFFLALKARNNIAQGNDPMQLT